MPNPRLSKFRPLLLGVLVLPFVLAACNPKVASEVSPNVAALDTGSAPLPPLPDVQQMVAGPAAPIRTAPAAAALPKARALSYASASGNDRYAFIDRANRINDTIGDAPPDYGFDYQDGVQPYGWESAGGYRTYAEPTDGGYRYYYYEPASNEPYLVRDPSYSYGYQGGRIATVYDRSGRALDGAQAQRQADYGSRYYERGRSMRTAADSRQRRGVAASGWANQRQVISTQRAEWNRSQTNNQDWRAYRGDHAVEDQRLAEERTARAQAARQFATWQSQGFRGETPAMYDSQQARRGGDGSYGQRQQAQQLQPQQQNAQLLAQQQVAQQQAARQQASQQQAAQQLAAQRQASQQTGQRQALARQQQLAQQAQRTQANQQRMVQAKAKSAALVQQHADKLKAQQTRVAAQTERLRLLRQTQATAKAQRVAAGADRLRLARERQVAVKAQAAQNRAAKIAAKPVAKPVKPAVVRPPRLPAQPHPAPSKPQGR